MISEPEEAPDFERSEHWPFGQEVTIAKGDKWPKHFLEECKDGLKDVFIYEVKKSKGYPGEMGARALYLLRVLMGSESFGDWLFNGCLPHDEAGGFSVMYCGSSFPREKHPENSHPDRASEPRPFAFLADEAAKQLYGYFLRLLQAHYQGSRGDEVQEWRGKSGDNGQLPGWNTRAVRGGLRDWSDVDPSDRRRQQIEGGDITPLRDQLRMCLPPCYEIGGTSESPGSAAQLPTGAQRIKRMSTEYDSVDSGENRKCHRKVCEKLTIMGAMGLVFTNYAPERVAVI